MANVVIDRTSATPREHVSYAWREYKRAERARRILEQRLSAARKVEGHALGRLVHICGALKLKAERYEDTPDPATKRMRDRHPEEQERYFPVPLPVLTPDR